MERLKGFRQELKAAIGRHWAAAPMGQWPGLTNAELTALVAPAALESAVVNATPGLIGETEEIVEIVGELGRRTRLIENSPAYKRARAKLGLGV